MINTTRLRCLIGWLGIALPWLVVLITGNIPGSISAMYFTRAQAVFMIILGSASILLISYKGYEVIDDLVSSLAGFFGLCICLFPCAVSDTHGIEGTFRLPMSVSNAIHCSAAVMFFGLLSINSIFLFTKTSGHKTKLKKRRNAIYIICGCGMILSFILLLFSKYIPNCTWVVETIALFFFGVSWLTKANYYKWLFAD